MFDRMVAYRDLLKAHKKPIAFFDSDILIIKRFQLDFSIGPALCQRHFNRNGKIIGDSPISINGKVFSYPENKNKRWGDVYPYIGCFFADKNSEFLDKAINVYKNLPKKYMHWYGDQVSLREAALTSTFCRVNEALIACLPESFPSGCPDAVALHFKGEKRKKLMLQYCNAFLNKKNQTDSYYPQFYRSNFRKLGYEIPSTLNPYFYKYLIGSHAADTEMINSTEIDLGARADLLCKIMYLLSKRKNSLPMHLGESAYRKHINALNQGKGKDSPDKLGIECYEQKFLDLYDRIELDKKFDSNISIIPLSYKSVLIDGSHRAAIVLFFKLNYP